MRIRKANRVMARKAGKLETIKTTLKELDITITDIEKNEAFILEMKKAAHTVHDYRHPSYVKHLLEDTQTSHINFSYAPCYENKSLYQNFAH